MQTVWHGEGDRLQLDGKLLDWGWALPLAHSALFQAETAIRALYDDQNRIEILIRSEWQWCWPALVLAAVHNERSSWLDIGPGHGTLMYALHTMGYNVCGIDRQPIIRGNLRNRVHKADMLQCTEAQIREWIRGPVLAVSLTQVLEHIPYNPLHALRTILRATNARYLVISTPHEGFPNSWKVTTHWRELPDPPEQLDYPDQHYKYYTEPELKELFTELRYPPVSTARSSTRIVVIGEDASYAE